MKGIIIVGYGRMGKEIEEQAARLEIPVCGIADSYSDLQKLEILQPNSTSNTKNTGYVAVEFSSGATSQQNLRYLLEQNIPVVCGSTPWREEAQRPILDLCAQRRGILMFSSNYSIGVHIFWHVVRKAASLLDKFPQYDVAVYEQHHRQKIDSPSGTAMQTAEIVLAELQRKSKILVGNPSSTTPSGEVQDAKIEPQELQISSQRLGRIPGMHQLLCESAEDSLNISHTAHGRSGFARGAITAAQFLHEQVELGNSGFFSMEDLMSYFLSKHRQSID